MRWVREWLERRRQQSTADALAAEIKAYFDSIDDGWK